MWQRGSGRAPHESDEFRCTCVIKRRKLRLLGAAVVAVILLAQFLLYRAWQSAQLLHRRQELAAQMLRGARMWQSDLGTTRARLHARPPPQKRRALPMWKGKRSRLAGDGHAPLNASATRAFGACCRGVQVDTSTCISGRLSLLFVLSAARTRSHTPARSHCHVLTVRSAVLVSEAISWVDRSRNPICFWEVGTAEGKGTTLSVVLALEWEQKQTGRGWRVVGYEAMPEAANKARRYWDDFGNVQVVQEFVLTGDDFENYVFPFIEGSETKLEPLNREFYYKFYGATEQQQHAGTLGGWLKTKPCKPDMVLIDSTRFAHFGILATLFHAADLGVDNTTVFVMENDFWEDGGKKRNTIDLLRENIRLEVLAGGDVVGERWPWVVMRASFPPYNASAEHQHAVEARARRLEHTRLAGSASRASANDDADVWGSSYKMGWGRGKAVHRPEPNRSISAR